MNEHNTKALIVGAGAMGLAVGYHLGLAGVDLTYLVRPSRLAELAEPQQLYAYHEARLNTFTGYRTVADVADIDTSALDYVLITLDGSAMRSADGASLLAALGGAVCQSGAIVLVGGVGVGLREYVAATMGLSPDRVLSCLLGALSYQVGRVEMPPIAPDQQQLLEQASLAYVQSGKTGLFIEARNRQAAKAFAALYNRSGVSRCVVINTSMFGILSTAPFPYFLISEIAGWPIPENLAKHEELWRLHRRAAGELMALPQHGALGRLLRLLMTERLQLLLWRSLERGARPMDLTAFNRFHHGGKVQEQDLNLMRDCVSIGRSQNAEMPALSEVLSRLERHGAARTSQA